MSVAAAQASNFIAEILENEIVWAIRDDGGFPTSTNADGEVSMPFWSRESRAKTTIEKVPAYRGFRPHPLTLAEFCERWLTGLERDGLLVGLNWSGAKASGYDIPARDVRARILSASEKLMSPSLRRS